MLKVIRKLIILIFFLIAQFLLAGQLLITPLYAADEFETTYNIDYIILSDGLCQVKQNVSLTNKLTNVYATEYKVTIGSNKIKSVEAADGEGSIKPEVKVEENITTINLKFNKKVVGKGQTLEFRLQYTTPDFSTLNGKVLEIGIPKFAEIEDLKDYQIRIFIPRLYGKAAYFIPEPAKQYQDGYFYVYEFVKNQLINQGISAAFGNSQILDFSFNYYIENSELVPTKFLVSFPSDSTFQQLFYTKIQPSPLNMQVDKDNNWLGVYQLDPKESLKIIASGSAALFIEPRKEFVKELKDPEIYLKSQKYWEAGEQKIISLANQLKTPKNIYQHVVSNLIYDYARIEGQVERFGAIHALENKESAICMEFTDLFVALCRAAGIPAREVNGYAYTNNPILRPLSLKQDVLHAWPEYYNLEKKLWMPVDPTWENTTGGVNFFNKLDFNHFAFVVHGVSSEYPLSAGSYKKSGQESKDVHIDFGDQVQKIKEINLNLDFPDKILAGMPIQGSLIVKNLSNYALYDSFVDFLTDFNNQNTKETVEILPPYGSFNKKINLGKTKWYQQSQIELKLAFGDKEVNHKVTAYPFWQYFMDFLFTFFNQKV